LYNSIKSNFYKIYKFFNQLNYHSLDIYDIYIQISITLKTIDTDFLSKYAIKAIKHELYMNSKHFILINDKYDNSNVSIMFTITFKSLDGYRAEEIALYSKDYEYINKIDYNYLQEKLLYELDDAVSRYRIEYFESLNIKVL